MASQKDAPLSEPRKLSYTREGLHATFNGGWHGNEQALRAFHHGMDTVMNVLEAGELAGAADTIAALQATVHRLGEEAEQLRVQLASCLVVAEGGYTHTANEGDYGWSLAYQRILELWATVHRLEAEKGKWQGLEHTQVEQIVNGKPQMVCVWACYACEKAGLQARIKFTADYESLQLQLASLSSATASIPTECADAANSARGLCESEARRWETSSPKTAEHWRSVATRLGALFLAQDHLSSATAEHFCIRCHHRWEGTALVLARYEYCGDCHRAAIATAEQRRQIATEAFQIGVTYARQYNAMMQPEFNDGAQAVLAAYLASEGSQ